MSVSHYWYDNQPVVALRWLNSEEPDIDEITDLKNEIDSKLWDDEERWNLYGYKGEYERIPNEDRVIMDSLVNILSEMIDELV
jgi:hypothetical protein